jgi:hypothetical protein
MTTTGPADRPTNQPPIDPPERRIACTGEDQKEEGGGGLHVGRVHGAAPSGPHQRGGGSEKAERAPGKLIVFELVAAVGGAQVGARAPYSTGKIPL